LIELTDYFFPVKRKRGFSIPLNVFKKYKPEALFNAPELLTFEDVVEATSSSHLNLSAEEPAEEKCLYAFDELAPRAV